jgi:hypothetical protein
VVDRAEGELDVEGGLEEVVSASRRRRNDPVLADRELSAPVRDRVRARWTLAAERGEEEQDDGDQT